MEISTIKTESSEENIKQINLFEISIVQELVGNVVMIKDNAVSLV